MCVGVGDKRESDSERGWRGGPQITCTESWEDVTVYQSDLSVFFIKCVQGCSSNLLFETCLFAISKWCAEELLNFFFFFCLFKQNLCIFLPVFVVATDCMQQTMTSERLAC